MKKIALLLPMAVMMLFSSGCSDSMNEHSGEGRVMLYPYISPELKVSRAVDATETQSLEESCEIWISSSRGLIRRFEGIQSIPQEGLWLQSGTYLAEAWAGDSVPASFESRYFKGSKEFTVAAGSAEKVDLACTLANVAVSVKYDESVNLVLSDVKLTVGHSCGELTWEGADERRGYFMMNSRNSDLHYTITGTTETGTTYEQKGIIEGPKGGHEYVLNVSHEGVDVAFGGAYFTIEIDENLIVIEDTITIMSAPQVTGVYQSLDQIYYGEKGNMERQGIFVTATENLTAVWIKIDGMDHILGGVGANDFDILYILNSGNEELHEIIESLGIRHQFVTSEEYGDDMKITFEPELLNQLDEGTYTITVTATDENKKTGTGTLTIVITDAVVEAQELPANAPTTWATKATVSATVMKDNAENVGINYRVKGAQDWQFIGATPTSRAGEWNKGNQYTVELTNLLPGTTYEYCAASSDFTSITIYEFTTEAAAQLPNCGFEDWYMDGKIQRICSSAADMFWDSGNKGSSTLNKALTTPCENPKHGGKYSAKLASEKVSIAFAAGNIFVGEFLGTENLTKGILGWGRKWSTRPKALRGYIKYTPAAISDVTDTPPGVTVNVGDMDTGILYIALTDETTMSYGSYSGWPQIVATKNISSYGFKASDPKVIAYGEKIFTEATPGEGLIEFEIPLDYYRTDVKASNIIVVGSASRYGDYYTGGPSVMYLDDLELVY